MAFKADELLKYPIPVIEQDLTPKDCMLYALGIGIGSNPMDQRELGFLYEKDLGVLPTMASVLAHPGFWVRDPRTGVDWRKVVHGEQSIEIHDTLPTGARLKGVSRVIGVEDKGAEKGAVVHTQRDVSDVDSDRLLASAIQTILCRGDGGSGSAGQLIPRVPRPPETEPKAIHKLQTLPQQALIYRLSGDYNPLHADPEAAMAAGFPGPILHGLATFGIAGYAILATVADYAVDRLSSMTARFVAPVFPGDLLQTDIWCDTDGGHYRVRQDSVIVAYGTFSLSKSP